MRVEVWSDIACPWCYIGKVRFEKALAAYEHRAEVEVVWRSYELQPEAPKSDPPPTAQHLMERYGRSREDVLGMMARVAEAAAAEGLVYDLERARAANTFDAHRLTHLGEAHGLGRAVMTRLMRAYQCEGEDVSSTATLLRLGVEAGLEEGEVRRVLASDDYADAVRRDERRARTLGVNGVPFFVFDGLHGVSGAQPAEFFLAALRQLGPQAPALTLLQGSEEGEACSDGSCEVP